MAHSDASKSVIILIPCSIGSITDCTDKVSDVVVNDFCVAIEFSFCAKCCTAFLALKVTFLVMNSLNVWHQLSSHPKISFTNVTFKISNVFVLDLHVSVQFSRESVCLITNLAFVFLYPIVNNFDVKFEANFRGVHFIANMTLIGRFCVMCARNIFNLCLLMRSTYIRRIIFMNTLNTFFQWILFMNTLNMVPSSVPSAQRSGHKCDKRILLPSNTTFVRRRYSPLCL